MIKTSITLLYRLVTFVFTIGAVKAANQCPDELPCYNRTLVFVADGPLELDFITSEEDYLDFFAKAGLTRSEVIAIGREALNFYLVQYGFDYTYISDEALLAGTTNGPQGTSLSPVLVKKEYRYRLTLASVSGKTFTTAQAYNTPVFDGTWFIFTSVEVQANGIFQGTIPPGAGLAYGHYIMRPCDTPQLSCSGPQKCHDILGVDSSGAILIQYNTLTYFAPYTTPVVVSVINCEVRHRTWGLGSARGLGFLRDPEGTTYDTRSVLSFPSLL